MFNINRYLKKGEHIMSKINVALIFGGKSGEHEVSLLSTASICKHINRDKYNVFTIGITKEGRWMFYDGNEENIKDGSWVNLANPSVEINLIPSGNKEVGLKFEDGRVAEYSFKQLEELELAYAITIHKSQGSEYPAVVIPLLSGPKMLLNRNLLYTAVTRARKCVTIVGSEETFREMINNEKQQRRYSSLDERLKEINEDM